MWFHITPWFEVGVLRGGVGVVMDGDRYLVYSWRTRQLYIPAFCFKLLVQLGCKSKLMLFLRVVADIV